MAWLWVSLVALLVALVGILLLSPKIPTSVEITPAQTRDMWKFSLLQDRDPTLAAVT